MPKDFRPALLWEHLGRIGSESRDFILNGQPEGYAEDTSLRYRPRNEHLVHSLQDEGIVSSVPLFDDEFPQWSRLTDLGRAVYEHGKKLS